MNAPRPNRSAFTLLELVIVLMILAALAGLVIAQVAQLGRTTDMAYTAKTQADVAENLQLHFVLNKRYPTHMDSLLVDIGGDGITAGGDGLTSDGVYVPAENVGGTWQAPSGEIQHRGLPDSGPHLDRALAPGQLTLNKRYRSFTRCGFGVLMDHDENATNANQSGLITRTLTNAATDWFAVLTDDGLAGSDAQKIIGQLFPATFNSTTGLYSIPTNLSVVAVGVGPRSSCIPDTMLNAPLYPGCDGSYYGHYVAFFACYDTGERANLIGVADSYGRLPVYSIQQFNESLPNNQRRG